MILDDWYMAEKERLEGEAHDRDHGKLMLGGMVFGQTYIGVFINYCLASLLAPGNRAAMADAVIALYTDDEGKPLLEAALQRTGIAHEIHVMPPEVMIDVPAIKYQRLAAAQSLLVQRAASRGMAFHALLADQVYSSAYFPNLFKLAREHGNIIHNGLNADLAQIGPKLNQYRYDDGGLHISADHLGKLASASLHARMSSFRMNDSELHRYAPDTHYILWRARDRYMIFGAHNTLAYIDAAACGRMDARGRTTGTLDVHTQRLVGANYYVPRMADDMVFIGVETSPNDCDPNHMVYVLNRTYWIDRLIQEIRTNREYICYYERPTAEIPAVEDVTYPTADVIRDAQRALAEELRKAIS